MRNRITLAALALIISLPLTVAPSVVSANTWYRVDNPGKHVDLFEDPNFQGKLLCRIPHGEVVHGEHRRLRVDGFVFVYWKKKFGVAEWHWKDAHGKWCPIWQRDGWVDLNRIKKINKPSGWWIN